MKCIVCRQPTEFIHELGSIAISNALSSKERFPLGLVFCSSCYNVQLSHHIDLKSNFVNYNYQSSVSVKDSLIHEIISAGLSCSSKSPRKIFEIASNDGYLLREYRKRLPRAIVVGCDPAENLLKFNRGIPIYCDFFSEKVAVEIHRDYGKFDLIHAHNVLAHVSDPCDLISGINTLLDDKGVAICDVQYLGATLHKKQFDNIYHEHFSYFSLSTLQKAFNNKGLYIHDAEIIESQGGTLRIYATKFTKAIRLPEMTDRCKSILESEVDTLDSKDEIMTHLLQIQSLVDNFKHNIRALRERGPVFGYGAAAKCNVILNLADTDFPQIEGIFDDSSTKIGKKIPGTSIPILDPKTMDTWEIGSLVVFPWNVMDKIVSKFPGKESLFISSKELFKE